MISASIIGASGYTGGDLLRILLMHSKVEVRQITSSANAGEYAHRIHPNLRGFTDLQFVSPKEVKCDCDVVFLCTPHGASFDYVKDFHERGVRVVDLSADFRLHSKEDYPIWYKHAHKYPELLSKAVYGIPELHGEKIKDARIVACAGCLSTSAILALAPLAKERAIDMQKIIIDSKVGSSASGHAYDASTHHPERSGVVRSYKPSGHRHTAEMEQELSELAGEKALIGFTPHAVELVRGILTTAYTYPKKELSEIDMWKMYRQFYKGKPFVRLVKEKAGIYRCPEPKIVRGTNFCDIGFDIDKHAGRLILICAIDNLVKGSGGQAVQCMNLMFGFDEKEGLWQPGLHPA